MLNREDDLYISEGNDKVFVLQNDDQSDKDIGTDESAQSCTDRQDDSDYSGNDGYSCRQDESMKKSVRCRACEVFTCDHRQNKSARVIVCVGVFGFASDA